MRPHPQLSESTGIASAPLTGYLRTAFLGVLILITTRPAHATEIQVVLSNTTSPALHGPAGGTGTTWNARGLTSAPLKDSAGNATSINFTADGQGPHGDWWCDLELLTGGLYDEGGGTRPLQITGLDWYEREHGLQTNRPHRLHFYRYFSSLSGTSLDSQRSA